MRLMRPHTTAHQLDDSRFGRRGTFERFVLGMALLVPLAVIGVAFGELPHIGAAAGVGVSPAAAAHSDAAMAARRPANVQSGPPPTLVPPVATSRPAVAQAAAAPEPTPAPTPGLGPNSSYTVRPGDELKGIAAQSGVSIWKIIAANDIPNPDSLRVGQVLHIPEP